MSRVLVLLVVLMMLSGCGGDPPPAAPGRQSPTPTATAAAPPVMPEKAKEDSKAGAEAFVRYYVRLINHAQATGDTTGLESASWKNCQSCSRVSRAVATVYERGGRIDGGQWTTSNEFAQFDKSTTSWIVVSRISYPRQISFDPGGKDREFKGGVHSFQFQVKFGALPKVMSWLIAD